MEFARQLPAVDFNPQETDRRIGAGKIAPIAVGKTMEQVNNNDLTVVRDTVRQFVAERDWDQFHTPKNLACALSVEVAELLEHFQWLREGGADELGPAGVEQARHEMADVLVYLVRLADKLDVDLGAAVVEKMALNRAKYPADKVRGDARKYDHYD
jgi:dCTP diphosphatase